LRAALANGRRAEGGQRNERGEREQEGEVSRQRLEPLRHLFEHR
jgi:hypothetical protein